MSAILIAPPYPGPWDTTREGGVKSAEGHLIGYCRYEFRGDMPRMQAASRWWAAAPSLTDATIALILAGRLAARELVRPKDTADALAAVGAAQRQALDALGRLRDPLMAENGLFNGAVTEQLERLRKAVLR